MSINELILETEKYLNSDISEQNESLGKMLLFELKQIEKDDGYVVSSAVMRSLIDSFDIYSEYWKKYFFKYWDSHLEKFQNPYE